LKKLQILIKLIYLTLMIVKKTTKQWLPLYVIYISIPGTNQYWAKREEFLAKKNIRNLWWGLNPWLTYNESDALHNASQTWVSYNYCWVYNSLFNHLSTLEHACRLLDASTDIDAKLSFLW